MNCLPLEQIILVLEKNLSPKLFAHSAGVAETAAKLALMLGADEDNARLAGWLHDCARESVPQDILSLAEASLIEIDEFCRLQPDLLHAPVGAIVARGLGVLDEAVLAAISRHTLGAPGMSLLDRIVYVADKIEPGRSYPEVKALRRKVAEDFHGGVLAVAAQGICYLLENKQVIHPLNIAFWNSLLLGPLGSEASGPPLPLHR